MPIVPVHLLVPCEDGPIKRRGRKTSQDGLGITDNDELRAIPAGKTAAEFAVLCSPSFTPTAQQHVQYTGEPGAVTCENCLNHPHFEELKEFARTSGRTSENPQNFMTSEQMQEASARTVEAVDATVDLPVDLTDDDSPR